MSLRTVVIVIGAITLSVLSRVLPHPDNVSPITALALFGAAMLADRRVALVLPLCGLLLSDVCKQLEYRWHWTRDQGFYSGMWTVYLAFLLVTCLGFVLRRNRNAIAIGGTTLAGSFLFFLVTNFAVWASSDGTGPFGYAHTLTGLATCYAVGIPFFGRTLLGDVSYAFIIFGSWALAERWVPALREAPAEA
jgi:hypothetical protein